MTRALLCSLVATGILLGTGLTDLGRPLPSPGAALAVQTDAAPVLLVSGLQLAGGARYNISVHRPLNLSVSNVRVQVTLPPDAHLLEVLNTPRRTVLLGSEGGVLIWGAPGYAPGAAIDAFAFLLAQPLSTDARIRASWDTDEGPASAELTARPALTPAMANEGALLVSASEAEDGFVPVGDTGVQLSVPVEAVPPRTRLTVRRPGPEMNPPSGVGSPWWCAALLLGGLPPNTEVFVLVPARQALPAGQPVALFAQREGRWVELEQTGRATPDGQFVGFSHPGGLVAAGIQLPPGFSQPPIAVTIPHLDPTPKLIPPTRTPTPGPQLRASITGTSAMGSFTSGRWDISLQNSGGPASQVHVQVSAGGGVIDFHSLTLVGNTHGFTCQVTQGVAASGQLLAVCDGESLGSSQAINAILRGGTTAVIGTKTRTIQVLVWRDYPDNVFYSSRETVTVQIN